MLPEQRTERIASRYDWSQFHAYRVFDEFLDCFVLQRKSYVTSHVEQLDLEAAFEDIRNRFVAGYDDTKASFEDKVALQFEGASEQTKVVFANIEYLWAMPIENIRPKRKRSYAQRWFFEKEQVVSGEQYFFGYPHIIANPGPWYLRNKYWELVATLRVLSLIAKNPDTASLTRIKKEIAEICHRTIYKSIPAKDDSTVSHTCGVYSALMHLSDPDSYESIISKNHREKICAVFKHVVESPSPDDEVLLRQIRKVLFELYGAGENPDRKHRWFFYISEVKPLWIDKKSKKAQRVGAAVFDVRLEEDAVEIEGELEEVKGYRIRRSSKLVKAAKERDKYTCQACGFHFENQIVHVHHLDPLSERKQPRETTLDDLITLCPNCHYLAHYWLGVSERYKNREELIRKLHSDVPNL